MSLSGLLMGAANLTIGAVLIAKWAAEKFGGPRFVFMTEASKEAAEQEAKDMRCCDRPHGTDRKCKKAWDAEDKEPDQSDSESEDKKDVSE